MAQVDIQHALVWRCTNSPVHSALPAWVRSLAFCPPRLHRTQVDIQHAPVDYATLAACITAINAAGAAALPNWPLLLCCRGAASAGAACYGHKYVPITGSASTPAMTNATAALGCCLVIDVNSIAPILM